MWDLIIENKRFWDIKFKDERNKKLNIVIYVKIAKGFLVHDIKKLPDGSENMVLLRDNVEVLKILKRINQLKQE